MQGWKAPRCWWGNVGWKSACNCSPSWEQMSFTKMSPNVTHSFKTRDMCMCVCILIQTWSWCWQARCSSLGSRLKCKVQTTMEFYKITVTAMELHSLILNVGSNTNTDTRANYWYNLLHVTSVICRQTKNAVKMQSEQRSNTKTSS